MHHCFASSILDLAMDLHFNVQILSPDAIFAIFAKVFTILMNILPLTSQPTVYGEQSVFIITFKLFDIDIFIYSPHFVISMMPC